MKLLISLVFTVSTMLAAAAQDGWQTLISETESGFVVQGAEKVDAEAALALLEEGAHFVDVRRAVQYSLAHIPGAVDLDVNSALTAESLSEHASKDQVVVFYCSDIGCDRSARASAMAISWGYEKVVYYAEGWSAWIAKDYPRN